MDEVDFFPPPASPAREILALAYAYITKIFPANVAAHQQLIALFLPECAGRGLFQLRPHNPQLHWPFYLCASFLSTTIEKSAHCICFSDDGAGGMIVRCGAIHPAFSCSAL
jgi:hypothetical protein